MKTASVLAAHPLRCVPYNKLRLEKFNHHNVPLYSVVGLAESTAGAFEALGKAFEKYGGRCFYCSRKFRPQPLSTGTDNAHRDHVVPTSGGGRNHLHNLVIACGNCGHAKAGDPIHDFRPKAAKEYLAALHQHIAECLKAEALTPNPSSPPQPKQAAAGGP